MKTKVYLGLLLTFCVLGLSACRNKYEIPTYIYTDSYNSVFEGKKVPQDVR